MPPARGAFLRAPRTPPAPDAAPVPSVVEPRPPNPFAAEDFDPPPLAPDPPPPDRGAGSGNAFRSSAAIACAVTKTGVCELERE